jgi:hypothetical protein
MSSKKQKKKGPTTRRPILSQPKLLESIIPHVQAVTNSKLSEQWQKFHSHFELAFPYLYLSLSSSKRQAFVYSLRTPIERGYGLGTMASGCECLSAALLLQARASAGTHPDQPFCDADVQVQRIHHWAPMADSYELEYLGYKPRTLHPILPSFPEMVFFSFHAVPWGQSHVLKKKKAGELRDKLALSNYIA